MNLFRSLSSNCGDQMLFDPFEHLAAKFVGIATALVPEYMTSLIFASPLSARSPDNCMLWHSNYRNHRKLKILITLLGSVVINSIKGIVKSIFHFKQFGYALYGNINDTLLVVPSVMGKETPDGEYKTPYVFTGKDDGIFVFGSADSFNGELQRVPKLKLKDKVIIQSLLIKSGINAFFILKGSLFEKVLLLLEWLSWVLSLQWIYIYYLEKYLSEVVVNYKIRNVGCIHEMHYYARIVWRVVSKYNATSFTVQHATISDGKRWYFIYPEEKKSGLILPNVMYVYNEKVIQLLRPYFENTKFLLGCSCRYSFWKETKEAKDTTKRKYFLFVGALAQFDNDVLIASIRNLLSTTKKIIPIRLRLHPTAKVSNSGKYWIHSKTKKGIIGISKNTPLKTDIEGAIAVVGMSTTVLEEALLMGCPVIQLTHPDYLQYIDIDGVPGAVKIDYRNLSVTDLLNVSNIQVGSESIRKSLGLNHPIVNYKQLFSKI